VRDSLPRRIAKRSLAPLLWRQTYRCLRLPWKQAEAAAPAASEPAIPIEIRHLHHAELARYGREPEYEISAPFIDEIAQRDDLCFGAFVDGKLASYRFFALQPTAIDRYLRFHFPARWIYAYKAFTLPSWRGKRLHRELFLGSLPALRGSLQGLREPLGFVTLVVSDNRPSLKAMMRLGFSPFESFSMLKVFSRPHLVSPSGDEAGPFCIQLTKDQSKESA
jgi:hypothetical protein